MRKKVQVNPQEKENILVLVDEIISSVIPEKSRRLIKALSEFTFPIVVAKCYRRPSQWGRKLLFPNVLYSFPAQNYNTHLKTFAAELVKRHAPAWVLAYGWDNSQLIVELSVLDVAVTIFIDHPSTNPEAEEQGSWAFLFADEILFSDETIPLGLNSGLWGLQSRSYLIQGTPATPQQQGFWLRRFEGREAAAGRRQIAAQVVATGRQVAVRRAHATAQALRDEKTILASNLFNTELFLPLPNEDDGDQTNPVARYLRASRHAAPRDRMFAGRMLRRPLEGFHPLIYASDHPTYDEASGEDPLAHYLRLGRPEGRWKHEIIRDYEDAEPATEARAALHAHFHYTELVPELVERLLANKTKPDLFVTTTSEVRRDEIAQTLSEAGITTKALTFDPSNRGRDIWPFLDLLRSGALDIYDVVGHVHGKRSPAYGMGDVWRDFLWRHLIGRPERMMDAVVARFSKVEKLGLVMPEDPHLGGWEKNLALGSGLAEKMGVPLPLPNHFEYPMGTMFWARPAALAPLLSIGLTAAMMPAEPLADDGTILHALERLIPFAVAKAGFLSAATYVRGSIR